jgi:hypothetical protein
MGALKESAASLRFFGDDLDPDEITALLGANPTVGVRKGAAWKTSRGREIIARTGSWRLSVPRREPGDLDAQIAEILAVLSDDLSVWAKLTSRYSADFFCGLFLQEGNEGLTLNAETLKALGLRGLPLDLDIYGAGMSD